MMRPGLTRCRRVPVQPGWPAARTVGLRVPPRWRSTAALPLVLLAACSSKPPPDYAPDPGLVAQISELRLYPTPARVCPGATIEAEYEALLGDGRVIPFASRYDKDHPPPLHVIFLRRTSTEADPREDGDWDTWPDPMASVMDGFRLHAALKARPSLTVSATVEPEYSCVPHAFRFDGRRGARAQPGFPGPDVVVRLDVLRSPFYERLLVASIEVGNAPPFYVLQDADLIPPSDWLIVESRGGRGGRGVDGTPGTKGQAGATGCPGGNGGAGGAGGNGGPGAPGGPGGHVTVIASTELPYLAGLVEARSPGGPGGLGGRGGEGGPGGDAGPGRIAEGRRCEAGEAGQQGPAGTPGPEGPSGTPGARARIITVSPADVFGQRVPPALGALLDYSRSRS